MAVAISNPSILLGVATFRPCGAARCRFGGGAAPARTFLVFFDWNRADLTARAGRSSRGRQGPHQQRTRIEVNGYTGHLGSAQYNQA